MWQQKRGNKYHAKSSIYNGNYYHSQFEAAYAKELDLRLKAKNIKAWKRQIRLPLLVHGKKVATYIMDFEIEHNDGSFEFVECKGFETDTFKRNWRHLEAVLPHEYPHHTLTLVKK